MTDVRIGTLRRRYRLSADSVHERARIDRVFNGALGNELFDAALERAGIAASDEVCIRHVQLEVRLHAAHDDAKLAVTCSVALADAIVADLASGGPNVVRFGSRPQALLDMALSVARGKLERAWAWRRLGHWQGDVFDSLREAEREVFSALARNPNAAPGVLGEVARAGLLGTYVLHVPELYWRALAESVLGASPTMWPATDAQEERARIDGEARNDQPDERDPAPGDTELTVWLARWATRIQESSPILRTVRALGMRLSSTMLRALAALALAEREPALAMSVQSGALVQTIVNSFDARHVTRGKVAPTAEPERTTGSDTPVDTRVHLQTQFGGLLFLLHAVRLIDLPGTFAAQGALSERSFRWVLHELAVLLLQHALGDTQDTTVLRDDAASFVFAGILAGTARDGCFVGQERANDVANESRASQAELALLQTLVRDIVTCVRERGGALPDESGSAMLGRIIERPAEIVADAAWIEARFSVNDTSTDIRRAGLDLDLGWLPWLGMVVRFAYA